MKRCTRCVMPDTRPDTEFIDGVCSACIAYERRKEIDWGKRKAQLETLLTERRRAGAEFDCIVPSSGGKDSTAQVLTLLEMGVKPLVVTATTCYLTDIGRRNIDNLARYATTIEVSPNKVVRAKLNKLGLDLVGDISWPEHVAIFTTPFKIAVAMGIPLIFYGENPQNQYGGPMNTLDAMHMTRRWVSEFGGFLGLRPADMVGQDGITTRDMEDYMPPKAEDIDRVKVEAHFLGQYLPWDSHRNADVSIAAGMAHVLPSRANWWDFENLDCALTGLHCHVMYRKYGYGRLAAQLSVDVRSEGISRDEAMEAVKRRDGLFPHQYMGVSFDMVCDHIGISKRDAMKAIDAFTNHELFCRIVDDRPILTEFQ